MSIAGSFFPSPQEKEFFTVKKPIKSPGILPGLLFIYGVGARADSINFGCVSLVLDRG
jgi:hypothetical protein